MRPPGILIVGGGITGLAAARKLAVEARQQNRPLAVELIESENRLGGKIRTEREDGYVVEGGPDAFISVKPAAMALCRTLGISDHVVGTDPRHQKTFIIKNGKMLAIPGGMTTFVPTEIAPFISTPLLSWFAKARIGLEPFIPRRAADGDVTMAEFFTRRLGRAGYEWLVEPLLAGIYAGDGRALGLAGTFPRYLEMEREHGSLLRAAFAARAAAAKAPPPKGPPGLFLSMRDGLCEMVDSVAAAAREAGVTISTGTALRGLVFESGGVRADLGDRAWQGDAVLLCTPAFVSADLIAERAPVVAGMLRRIPYVSTVTATFAFDQRALIDASGRAVSLDGYGFVVPRPEQRQIIACTWTSSKWPGRVPPGKALIRCYLGGAGHEDVLQRADDDLAEVALGEVRKIMGMSASPERVWLHRWPDAMPQYLVGHPERIATLGERIREIPGLHLAGAAYRGIGIPDCIQDGEAAAARILS